MHDLKARQSLTQKLVKPLLRIENEAHVFHFMISSENIDFRTGRLGINDGLNWSFSWYEVEID